VSCDQRSERRLVACGDKPLQELAFGQADDSPLVENAAQLLQDGTCVTAHVEKPSQAKTRLSFLYLLRGEDSNLPFPIFPPDSLCQTTNRAACTAPSSWW
jgi:hypothetical protein